MRSQLSRLQVDLLRAFFKYERGYFLTGGAALAGFHLGHRTTEDLDLFSLEDRIDDGDRALRAAAEQLGATIESIQVAPDFRRRLVRRGQESVIVDLVREHVPQVHAEKLEIDGVRVDPADEILANNLCALLSHGEARDLVDVMFLERAGHSVDEALPLAQRKDTALTAAQLAWVLSQISLGADARIPGQIDVAELRGYLADLQARLRRLASPR